MIGVASMSAMPRALRLIARSTAMHGSVLEVITGLRRHVRLLRPRAAARRLPWLRRSCIRVLAAREALGDAVADMVVEERDRHLPQPRLDRRDRLEPLRGPMILHANRGLSDDAH
ncbi:MAG TPA: hypothetical protein VEQ37_13180 [Actinomycetota bacterium]|nr:hypothetical protein [Actinomycetota bacterium]